MNATLQKVLAFLLTTGAITCQAGWTGPMIEAPVNDDDPSVQVAKKLGTFQPTYIVQPEVCENFRKNKQCVQEATKDRPRKDRRVHEECDKKFPWANNGNWNRQVGQTCSSAVPPNANGSATKGNHKTIPTESPKSPPKSSADGTPIESTDETVQKAATDAAARAIKSLFGR